MTNKRIIALITLLVIATLAVLPVSLGCGPSTTTTPPATTPPATTPPATTPTVQTITLRWTAGTQGLTTSSVPGRNALKFIEDVAQASGGRVKINVLTGAAPDPELYDVIAKGAGDITYNPIMFNAGRFPTLEAMTVPEIGTVCRHPSKVAYELWQSSPNVDKEFSDAKLIGVFTATQAPPGISFATISKPIRTLEDFKGIKMGVYGEWGTKTVAALGGAPVAVPPPAIYESLQRKIVDGSAMDPEILEASKVYEVVKYWHYLNFQFVPFFLVMNNNSWNGLPADIQKIILDKAALMPDRIDADFRESTVRALDTGVKEYGMEVIEYTPAELDKWRAAQKPVIDEYKSRLTEKGIDANKLFDDLKALYAKYAEW